MDGAACYNTNKIPRTQDIQNVFAETTGLYVYTKKLIKDGRRIGSNPYGVTVDLLKQPTSTIRLILTLHR